MTGPGLRLRPFQTMRMFCPPEGRPGVRAGAGAGTTRFCHSCSGSRDSRHTNGQMSDETESSVDERLSAISQPKGYNDVPLLSPYESSLQRDTSKGNLVEATPRSI